jgi:hypothetical protein
MRPTNERARSQALYLKGGKAHLLPDTWCGLVFTVIPVLQLIVWFWRVLRSEWYGADPPSTQVAMAALVPSGAAAGLRPASAATG